MDYLSILVVLYLVDYIYKTFIKNMIVINLNYAVSSQIVEDHLVKLEIDLNRHFTVDNEDYRLVNPIIHLSLPYKIFPTQKDTVSFEYELILVNIKDQKTFKKDCIVIIKLIDLLIENPVNIDSEDHSDNQAVNDGYNERPPTPHPQLNQQQLDYGYPSATSVPGSYSNSYPTG